MEVEKIRELTDEELKQQLQTAGEGLFRIRFQKSMGNLEGLKGLRESKQVIARVKTIQRERELGTPLKADAVLKGNAPATSERTARKRAKKVS